ncbi:MAG: hypothetical protein RIQ93_3016 [Verrucomicrobiota bacterium]|jgi:dipeptidyl aminopeptidase/acylaminoacyl peptidase
MRIIRPLLRATSCAVFLACAQASARDLSDLEEILRFPTIGDLNLSADGRFLAYARGEPSAEKDVTTVYALEVAAGAVRKVGVGHTPKWSPDGGTLAFFGKGRQVWIAGVSGEPRQITKYSAPVAQYCWSPDGKKIAFTAETVVRAEGAAARPMRVGVDDVPFRKLWVVDVVTGKAEEIAGGDYSVGGSDQWFLDFFSWSPDSSQIAFSRRLHGGAGGHLDGDVAVVDVRTRAVRVLVSRPGMEGYPMWSPDGRGIAFITTSGRRDWVTASDLDFVDVATGAITRLSRGFDEKIKDFYWTADSRYILFNAWQGVSSEIFEVDVAARSVRRLSTGEGVISDLTVAANGSVAFIRESGAVAPDVYVASRGKFEPRRLTRQAEELKAWPKLESRVVRWPSFDGMMIEGILTLPANYQPGTRYPLLVHLHGGPHAAEHDEFMLNKYLREFRWFAGHGWAVFRPNYRGSGGYGEKFLRANLFGWGIGDYQDIMSGVDHLIATGVADSDRLAVNGGSYGGYLSSWIITHTNRFKAAVVGCAIVDVPSFVRTTDLPERFESYLGTDERAFPRHSPSTYIHNISTPALIWHGDSDPRVPLMQSRFLYTAMRDRKTPVEFIIYPNSGHGVGPAWIGDLATRTIAWFDKYVPGVDRN